MPFQLSSNLFPEGDSLNHFFLISCGGKHLGNAVVVYTKVVVLTL